MDDMINRNAPIAEVKSKKEREKRIKEIDEVIKEDLD